MEGVTIREATVVDLAAVLEVQRDAFGRVARASGIPEPALPPLNETVDQLAVVHATGMRFWVAEVAGRVVGSVRAALDPGDVAVIGRLVVSQGHTRRGIATALMDTVEAAFPQAVRFELFTADDAEAPLALYRGRGYIEDRTERMGPVTLVWLAKPGPAALR